MDSFKWLFAQAEEKKKDLIVSILLATASTLCAILPYLTVIHIISALLDGERDTQFYFQQCLLLLLLWGLSSLFHSLSTAMSHTATFHILSVLRKKCLDQLTKMPLGDVLNKGTGSLKNIIVERIDAMETPLAHILPEFTSSLLSSLCIMIIIFVIDWRMGLASLITLPLGMACYMGMMNGYEESYTRAITATKNLNDTAIEYINGIQVIKVFGTSEEAYGKFVLAAKEGANAYIDWMRKNIPFFTFAMQTMPNTMVTVLPIGALLYMHGKLSAIDLISVIVLAIGMITPLVNCMSYSDDIATLGTTVGEVKGILDAKTLERPKELKEPISSYDLTLKDVHFSYGEKEVLHGINLSVPKGSYIALVGPSGSGKSTIAKLIAELWDVNSGSITLGNTDIKDIPLDEYNKHISYVSQNNYLFNCSVMENIRMGAVGKTATDEEVIEAAKKCGCHEFIMGLENGYDTIVGSAGGHLSGGERQRISIARAMLKNAEIIILDEATAYTDPESEALIQSSISSLVQGKTLIVIAHRLSTVQDADCIYVVKDGEITEQGTHTQLLENHSTYEAMWKAHISSRDGGEN